jgi:hypothetical protein
MLNDATIQYQTALNGTALSELTFMLPSRAGVTFYLFSNDYTVAWNSKVFNNDAARLRESPTKLWYFNCKITNTGIFQLILGMHVVACNFVISDHVYSQQCKLFDLFHFACSVN